MLVSVFGDPSKSSLNGLRIIQALTEVSCGSYEWVCVGSAADLALALKKATSNNIVFFSDSPDHNISNLFIECRAPATVFVHNPYAIAASLQRFRGLDEITSIRVTTQSLSCLHDLAIANNYYSAPAPADENDLTECLSLFSRLYNLHINSSIVKRTIERLAAMNETEVGHPDKGMPAALEIAATASSPLYRCLKGFEGLLARSPVQHVHWPAEVFMDPSKDGALWNGPIDLTGPARLLLYGPFLHLPKGNWTATIALEVHGNWSGNVLKIDAYYEGIIGEWQCELPANGAYAFEIPLNVPEPRHPLQIRFYITQGAIEGVFDLKHIDLRRTGETNSNAARGETAVRLAGTSVA
jgi:hypothetical protein